MHEDPHLMQPSGLIIVAALCRLLNESREAFVSVIVVRGVRRPVRKTLIG